MSNTNQVKCRTIVIDFPWNVKVGLKQYGRGRSSRLDDDLPYETMSNEQILNFPIDDFADLECDLFVWVTHTTLPIGLEFLKKWGFTYHCLITWDKQNGLSLLGFHRKTEYCIYAYRGKMGIKLTGKIIPTLISQKSTGHSKKPDKFYALIARSTKEPRIDIFARKRHPGFEAWGNQIEPMTQNTLEVFN